MSNTNHPTNHEEQSPAIPTDYRALLAMTRPLFITEHSLPSWRGGQVCRSGFGMPLGPKDRRAELALRRGEILHLDEWGFGVAEDEELATTEEKTGTMSAPEGEGAAAEPIPALQRRDSNLQIRICLGMS